MWKCTFLFLLLSVASYAYDLNDTTVVRLSDVEVKASRSNQFSAIGQVVKQINAADIRLLPVQGLDALLKSVAGVDVRQRGPGGTQADVSLRGGSFDQVLILLNGVNITDPQTGHHQLDIPVDLSEVSKIEVLQGSASRRYSGQAFSGAINIVTDPKAKSLVDAQVSYGYFNTQTQKLTVGLGNNNVHHFTSFSHSSSDGYRANTDYTSFQLFSQTHLETKQAGSFDVQLGWQRKSFGANGFYSLAYPDQFEHTETQFSTVSWNRQWENLTVKANAFYRRHYDRFELFRDFKNAETWYVDHNYHLTDVGGGNVDVQYFTPFGKLSGGVALKYDHIYSTVLGKSIAEINDQPINRFEKGNNKHFNKEDDRWVKSGYFDFSKGWDQLFLSTGISFSQTNAFGVQTHVGGDLSYFLTNRLGVFVSANTASRLPTFTDLYYQSATQSANPALQPEHSITYELGVNYQNAGLQLSTGAFYRKGTNIIDWVKFPEQTKWESMNLTSLTTIGAEGSAVYAFRSGWMKSLSLAYAYLHTDKAATDFDSKYALDYLAHQLVLQATHDLLPKVSLSWSLNFNDRAGDYAEVTAGALVAYRPYLLLSNRISWQLRYVTIYADLNNLLNDEYVDFGGLPQPGFHAIMGLKWRI